MDSLAIQRSLTILEDRYRELREIGEKRFASFDGEIAALPKQLQVVREEKEGLVGELKESLDEIELCTLQLHQVQEELEHYFLECQSRQASYKTLLEECALKDDKLVWLRNQRVLLIGLIKYQAAVFQRFTAISVRLTRALNSSRDTGQPAVLLPFRRFKAFLGDGRPPGKNQPTK